MSMPSSLRQFSKYSLKIMMRSDTDLAEATLNRADLKPKKRLHTLIETSKNTHIDPQIPIRNYMKIADAFLTSAKQSHANNSFEAALISYLRYESLVKKLNVHPNYKNLPLGERSAFDYKLKNAAKKAKILKEEVLTEYRKFYHWSKFDTQDQSLEGYQEQRPTLSTVRTFISGIKGDLNGNSWSQPSLAAKASVMSRSRSGAIADSASSVNVPMHRGASSYTDANMGIRRSIFPTKQVKEFDMIHGQRRIVRSHRTVIVPSRITTEFSYLSYKCTQNNIETVAYLAGKELNDSQLLVTHLILPAQVGFSDYFKVRDSVDLIKYLDYNDLLTLGWIHSHPIESNYLSSSDMHYHSVFQSVLPEAIAIVYSPKYMNSTVFNLTPNHGLKYILNCEKKGFHTHPTNPPLTMVCQHAITDLYADLTVKDFRSELKPNEYWDDRSRTSTSSNLFERMMKDRPSLDRWKLRKSEVTFVHIGRK